MAVSILGKSLGCCATSCSAATVEATITEGQASPVFAAVVDMFFSEPVIIISFIVTHNFGNTPIVTGVPPIGQPSDHHVYSILSAVGGPHVVRVRWKNSSGPCKGLQSSAIFTYTQT